MSTAISNTIRLPLPAGSHGHAKRTDDTPHDYDSELAIISILILFGADAPPELLDAVDQSDFFDDTYRILHELLVDGIRQGFPIANPKQFRASIKHASEARNCPASFDSLWEIYLQCISEPADTTFWKWHVKNLRQKGDARKSLAELAAARLAIVNGDPLEAVLSHLTPRLHHLAQRQVSDGPKPGPILTRLDQVEDKETNWLWQDRIPIGGITTVCGFPGEGKSFFCCAVAVSVSRGYQFNDGATCPLGNVLVLAGEDRPSQLKKRYHFNGADMERIHLLQGQHKYDKRKMTEAAVTLRDIEVIREAVEVIGGIKLVIIDPIGDYIPGVDSNKDNEVRTLLTPIADLAEEREFAVLMVCHRKKSGGERPDNAALGSVAFVGKARSVLHVMADPEDTSQTGKRKLVLAGKINDAEPSPGMAFWIQKPDGMIAWDSNAVDTTATEAMRAAAANDRCERGPDPYARHGAEKWLKEFLKDGPRLQKEIESEAKAAEGISLKTLKRAKAILKIESVRSPGLGPWSWRLPE